MDEEIEMEEIYVIANQELNYLVLTPDHIFTKWNSDPIYYWYESQIKDYFNSMRETKVVVLTRLINEEYTMDQVEGWLVVPACVDDEDYIIPDFTHYTKLGNFLNVS